MAVDFLEKKEIEFKIYNRPLYLFKLASGEIDTIDKRDYQNWGAILFMPSKAPKVVFLNEIAYEFDLYFE